MLCPVISTTLIQIFVGASPDFLNSVTAIAVQKLFFNFLNASVHFATISSLFLSIDFDFSKGVSVSDM